MDNIGQIVYQTIGISLPEFIRLGLAGMAGGLIGAYANDRLTRKRDRESGIKAEKMKFIPLIEGLIDSTEKCGRLLGDVHPQIHAKLFEPAHRFRLLILDKPERLRLFDEAWGRLANTTHKEAPYQQPNMSESEYARMRQTLKARFEAVRKVVQDS